MNQIKLRRYPTGMMQEPAPRAKSTLLPARGKGECIMEPINDSMSASATFSVDQKPGIPLEEAKGNNPLLDLSICSEVSSYGSRSENDPVILSAATTSKKKGGLLKSLTEIPEERRRKDENKLNKSKRAAIARISSWDDELIKECFAEDEDFVTSDDMHGVPRSLDRKKLICIECQNKSLKIVKLEDLVMNLLEEVKEVREGSLVLSTSQSDLRRRKSSSRSSQILVLKEKVQHLQELVDYLYDKLLEKNEQKHR